MDYKIVTPLMLWQDFNPTREPLEVTVNSAKITGAIIEKDVTFTSETVSDGKVRARALLCVHKGEERHPTILFLTGGESLFRRTEHVDNMLDRGYNVCSVDFGGEAPRKNGIYTVYPESLSHCNYYANRSCTYTPTLPDESMWFTWMKVIRRAMTMILEEGSVDKDNLFLMGTLEGGQLAWKVAGIDGRLKGVLPMGAAGFTEYMDSPKYGTIQKNQFSDEWECYLAGMSTQAYARMIDCPIYFIMGTNSSYADIDRVSDLFHLIQNKKKYHSFSVGGNVSIDRDNFDSALKWIDLVIAGRDEFKVPQIDTYVSEGKLYASVTNFDEDSKVEIYYAMDEVTPAFRSWTKCDEITTLNGEAFSEILPYEENEKLFLFANVITSDGIRLSTHEILVDLLKFDLTEYDTLKNNTERILFSPEMDVAPFSVENLSPVVDLGVLKYKNGPFGIRGFMTTEGRLCTYDVDPPVSDIVMTDDYILQVNAYSEEARDIRFVMFTSENNNTKYTCTLHLNASKRWQRFNMSKNDFKRADNRTLKSWSMVKKMKIKDAENILFTNILWI